nr:hypothetical protein [uncultured Acidocella sp.]
MICNAIPHLAAGLRGEPFPTPFATPRGVGLSSPVVNHLWGWFNLFLGLVLLQPRALFLGALPPLHNSLFWCFGVGFLLCGLYLATHFGKVRTRQG